MQLLALGQRVADLEYAVVGQTYDVAGPCLVDGRLALRHKLSRRGEAYGFVLTYMQVRLVSHELARAYLAEGDTRTVVGVDVCCYLEDKSRKLVLVRLYHSLHGLCLSWRWRYLHEAVEKLLYTEVVESRTEEHRCHLGIAVVLKIELGIYTAHQFQVLTQFLCVSLAHLLVEFLGVDVHCHLLRHALLVGHEEVELLLIYIIYALETYTLVDRPRQRDSLYLQFLLQFVKQVERVAAFTVHLVDEYHHWRVAHAAHLHEFPCLGLHTLGAVHHDDGRVHGRQCAVGVFRKVLVTWSVEYVHLIVMIVKLHDGGANRYTALFFDVHPVGCRGLAYLVALYCASHLYLSTEEEEFLRQSSLTRVRV